jgi:hypothetical protein
MQAINHFVRLTKPRDDFAVRVGARTKPLRTKDIPRKRDTKRVCSDSGLSLDVRTKFDPNSSEQEDSRWDFYQKVEKIYLCGKLVKIISKKKEPLEWSWGRFLVYVPEKISGNFVKKRRKRSILIELRRVRIYKTSFLATPPPWVPPTSPLKK